MNPTSPLRQNAPTEYKSALAQAIEETERPCTVFPVSGFFHLGGTKVLGILVTMDAEQGVQAVRLVDPDVAIPIHYDDYDVFTSSLEDFTTAAEQAGLGDRLRVLHRGDSYPMA